MRRRDTQSLPHQRQRFDSLIGKGTSVEGKVAVSGTLRVDGVVSGEVEASGDLVVGESGVVNATVRAANVAVAGELHGDVETSGMLEIVPTGRLFGDVKVTLLSVDEGAVFKGQCEMVARDRERSAQGGKPRGQETPLSPPKPQG